MDASPGQSRGCTPLPLAERAYDEALGCVHCGLCLPVCPTYTQTGHEADSPRGRLQLMRALAEGAIEPTQSVRDHLDLCLDCRGCETACPSGVVFHEVIEDTRVKLDHATGTAGGDRVLRWIFLNVFTVPRRLKLAMLPARLLQKLGLYRVMRKMGVFKLLPVSWAKMERMLPAAGSVWARTLPERAGNGAKRIGFFGGCIGSVVFDKVNRQACELLVAGKAQVLTPRGQGCCGAIHFHNAEPEEARRLARRNIDAFLEANVDSIVTTVAGCGAMLKEYDALLRVDPAYADRAKEFAGKVRDISQVLVELELPLTHAVDETVTYHDACHLAHAQKVTEPPRQLLARIPGLTLVPLGESDICCGAAGTYNLTQPKMATDLADRKLKNIAATGSHICVTANVGCAMHIQSEAEARGHDVSIVHPVQLLHQSLTGTHPRH